MRYQQKKKKASKILGWLSTLYSFVNDKQPGWKRIQLQPLRRYEKDF